MIAYGFIIFFGWITAIILGMTFKTLPFIVWNKVYHQQAGKGKTPNPKDLFSATDFSNGWRGIYFRLYIIYGRRIGLQLLQFFCSIICSMLLITSLLYIP
jgi:hypothetical protein